MCENYLKTISTEPQLVPTIELLLKQLYLGFHSLIHNCTLQVHVKINTLKHIDLHYISNTVAPRYNADLAIRGRSHIT